MDERQIGEMQGDVSRNEKRHDRAQDRRDAIRNRIRAIRERIDSVNDRADALEWRQYMILLLLLPQAAKTLGVPTDIVTGLLSLL
jgi:chromosome segregation ATPase